MVDHLRFSYEDTKSVEVEGEKGERTDDRERRFQEFFVYLFYNHKLTIRRTTRNIHGRGCECTDSGNTKEAAVRSGGGELM
jgi:hypothetical protein